MFLEAKSCDLRGWSVWLVRIKLGTRVTVRIGVCWLIFLHITTWAIRRTVLNIMHFSVFRYSQDGPVVIHRTVLRINIIQTLHALQEVARVCSEGHRGHSSYVCQEVAGVSLCPLKVQFFGYIAGGWFLTGWMPFLWPIQRRQSTEGISGCDWWTSIGALIFEQIRRKKSKCIHLVSIQSL